MVTSCHKLRGVGRRFSFVHEEVMQSWLRQTLVFIVGISGQAFPY